LAHNLFMTLKTFEC